MTVAYTTAWGTTGVAHHRERPGPAHRGDAPRRYVRGFEDTGRPSCRARAVVRGVHFAGYACRHARSRAAMMDAREPPSQQRVWECC